MRFAQGEGYVQVGERPRAACSSRRPRRPTSSTRPTCEERIRRAEQELERAEEDSEAARRAERDKRRWEAFLAIAGGGSDSSSH